MKKLLFKTTLFFIGLIVIFSLSSSFDSFNLKRNFPTHIQTLIAGDSHAECGINDKIYPNSKNISQPGEIHFFVYYKLKKIVKYSKIDTLIISFSSHNLSAFQDEKLFGIDSQYAYQRMYPKNFACLGANGIIDLLDKTKLNFGNILTYFTKGFIMPYITRKNDYIGKYRKSAKSVIGNHQMIKTRISDHFYRSKDCLDTFSTYQQVYLNRIIQLCDNYKIKLILVDIPVSPYYRALIPKKFLTYFNDYVKNKIPNNVTFLDFSNYRYPDSDYGDGDHFNTKGAIAFTKQLLDKVH